MLVSMVADEALELTGERDCSCVSLAAEDWDRVESDWSDIQFVRTTLPAVMGVPLRYEAVRAALAGEAAKLGATVPEGAMLLIGEGRFRRPVLLEIEGAPPNSKGVERPGGVAFTRLVPAPWGEMKRVMSAFHAEVRVKYGRMPDATWVWYLTCGKCSAEREFETLFVAHMAAGR